MAKKFRKIKLEEIDAETTEGKLLLMAISKIKTMYGVREVEGNQLILDSLVKMANEVYFDELNETKPLSTRIKNRLVRFLT